MSFRIIALIAIATFSSPSQAGEVYRYVDSKGRIEFSDKRRHDGYVPLVETKTGWEELRAPNSLEEGADKYRPLVEAAALRYGVAADLVNAVIHAESHFNPVAVSPKGAVGLMQLMPATAERYGVQNRQDPKQNIEAGVRYIAELMEMFDNETQLVLAAYNAGENAVIKQGNRIPPFTETKKYVRKVLSLRNKYQNNRYVVHVGEDILLEPRARNLHAGI